MSHNPFATKGDEESFDINEDVVPESTLEEGEYIVKCVGVEKGTSKSDNPMFIWDFQIISTAAGVMIPDAPEKKVYTALTDAAMWKVEETVCAMGLGQVVDGKLQAKFTPSDAKGILCVGVISIGEFNNRPSLNIDKLMPHPSGAGFKGSALG